MTDESRGDAAKIDSVRARTLSSAAEILASQGPEKLSLRAIADAAGIGLASIYHYFKTKDALLLILAIEGFEDLRRRILEYQVDPAFLTPMRGGHRAFFTFAEARPALFSLMFSERLMARHVELRDAERKTFQAYQAGVEADGRIPAAYCEKAAMAIWAMGRGMAATISSQPGGRLPPETAAKLFAGAAYLLGHPFAPP